MTATKAPALGAVPVPAAAPAPASAFTPHKPRVACLLMDGMWSHDMASVVQVFGSTLAEGGSDPCDLVFLSEGELVELDHGIMVRTMPVARFDGTAELVCIPGFVDPFAIDDRLAREHRPIADIRPSTAAGVRAQRMSPELRAWLSGQSASGSEICALGTGAFALALAGLLSGVHCTTHWLFASELSRLFPEARVDAARMLAFDERTRIRTSAGGASGVDLCLAALVDIAGHGAASSVAAAMNLWSPRSLDARQDAFGMARTSAAERAGEDIEQLKDAVHRHMDHSWSVSEMAWYVGMSTRTFQRRFQEVMGETPTRWIAGERMAVAAQLLEETDLPLPLIASRVGLSSADILRKRFQDRYGEAPSAYRKRLRARGALGARSRS